VPEAPGKVAVWGLDQEVIVVGEKAVGRHPKMPIFARLLNGSEKDFVIFWISENRFPPPSSIQDVIPGMGIFEPKRAGHGLILSALEA
jgi:hypothetical protein